MPQDRPRTIDDSELEEKPFYVDADGNPQVRDVGGFAPSDESGLDANEEDESSPTEPADKADRP
jgi:hypothetical protein